MATCQTYYYVVTITNAGNESLPSAEASASLPGGAPPSPWLNTDIGSVGLPGSVTYCNGQFTISGSGADIWGTNDAFQFVYIYLPISTNCDIRARVVSVQNTSGNAKAAVMIRESLAAGSRQVLADGEYSAGNRVHLAEQHRRIVQLFRRLRNSSKLGAVDAHQQYVHGLLFRRRQHVDPARHADEHQHGRQRLCRPRRVRPQQHRAQHLGDRQCQRQFPAHQHRADACADRQPDSQCGPDRGHHRQSL